MEEYNLPLYRSWFPFLSTGKIWMNHAAVSPLSLRVSDAVSRYLHRCAVEEIDTYLSSLPIAAKTKKNLGTMIGTAADRIAFVGNTSDGLNVLASGLEWHPGDRIILNDSEFPSNIVPFINLKRHGVEIDFLETQKRRNYCGTNRRTHHSADTARLTEFCSIPLRASVQTLTPSAGYAKNMG